MIASGPRDVTMSQSAMCSTAVRSFFVFTAASSCLVMAQSPGEPPAAKVPLTVSAGVPLRLYLTKRLTKREGEPVHAKVLEPVFAFDRQVIPAGSEVEGRVSHLKSVPKMTRISAILNGDFTPLHVAEVEFTTLLMPDGRQLPLKTAET